MKNIHRFTVLNTLPEIEIKSQMQINSGDDKTKVIRLLSLFIHSGYLPFIKITIFTGLN